VGGQLTRKSERASNEIRRKTTPLGGKKSEVHKTRKEHRVREKEEKSCNHHGIIDDDVPTLDEGGKKKASGGKGERGKGCTEIQGDGKRRNIGLSDTTVRLGNLYRKREAQRVRRGTPNGMQGG